MSSPGSQTSIQRAKEYTPEEWEAIRERFTRLYQTPKLTLSSIQALMKEKYGFEATLRQYKRKVKLWNLERNIKLDDSKFMVQKEAQRKQEGKKTKFIVKGREVSEAKFARIRRKLLKNSSPANPWMYTPINVRYFTPRDAGNNNSNHTRRPSISHANSFTTHHTHLVECFLCNVNTYGLEHTVLQSFQDHIQETHPGYNVLRFLNGYDASLVRGAVRTTHQLPSNQVGYVHGIRTDNFDTVRLGRLCHAEDQGGGGKRPYLTLTHNASCITLRADPRQEVHFDAPAVPPPPQASISHYPMDASLDFGQAEWSTTPFALSSLYQDEFDSYFSQISISQDEYPTFEDWNFEDDNKEYWKAGMYEY